MPHLIRICLPACTTTTTRLTGNNLALGGRALTSFIISHEVPPTCDPLGPDNKLVFACGPLAGTPVSSASRLSVGGKSPLTGGIKESNAGGTTAHIMGRMDIRAVVLEGALPQEHPWVVVHISANGVRFLPADDLCGLGVYEKARRLRASYGEHTGISLIGVAGERHLYTAGITNCDMDGEPSRYNGRGGLGAVMGSKRIHALIFDSATVPTPGFADKTEFLRLYRDMAKAIYNNTAIFRKYGTASVLDVTSNLGALPTRNYSAGRFEHAKAINGVALHALITQRGGAGRASHACMPGCLIQCSNIFPDKDGNKLCSPIEYENLGMLGSNLGIGSLDDIAELNRLCNDLGCDTIETGAALGVLMEQGLCAFGDAQGAMAILREIFSGGVTGLLAGSGAFVAGKVLGASRVPVSHGQSFAAYDPRSMKGMGMTYATTPQGADHTAGSTLHSKIPQSNVEGQLEESRNAQEWAMLVDMLGVCLFMPGSLPDRAVLTSLITARYGLPLALEDFFAEARRLLAMECAFNRAAGLAGAELPLFMRTERNPSSGHVFDVPHATLNTLADQLLQGASIENGFFAWARA